MASCTLEKVISLAAYYSGVKSLSEHSAVDQDMGLTGINVNEFAVALRDQFGANSVTWPFHRPPLAKCPYDRLELGHIAAVIDKGEWF